MGEHFKSNWLWLQIPAPKPPTKWEKFAAQKGITPKARNEGNMVFDEASGEWVKKWGYKGQNKQEENQWLVEIDDKKTSGGDSASADPRKLKRDDRRREIRKNLKRYQKNQQKVKKWIWL